LKGLQGVADWGPPQWSAAGNVATAIIALLAVIYAALQVREAKRAREAQTQPFVVVSLQPSPVANFIIELVVENIGSTLARDVSFRFDPPLKSSLDDSRLEDSYLIQHGIPTMPPKMRLARVFDSANQRQEAGDLPWRFNVEVRFSDYRGRAQEKLQYVLDLEPYRSGTFLEERGIHHAAKALEEIRKVLKASSRGQRLRVSVQDEDYKNWSDQWQRDRGGRLPSLGNPWPAGRRSPSKYQHLEGSRLARFIWRLVHRLRAPLAALRDRHRPSSSG
jgi:hypothetical protein